MLNRRRLEREYALLTKALFHSEPPRAHPVVESLACSHATVELTNDRDHILWQAKTVEYCPEEGSINRVVRFGKVDKAYIQRNSLLPRQLPQPTNHMARRGCRASCSGLAIRCFFSLIPSTSSPNFFSC